MAAVVVLAVVLGATAAPARSTSTNTWCVHNAKKLPPHSWATSLICPTSKKALAKTKKQGSPLNRQIASAINSFRRAHGLRPLHVSYRLNAASRQHSQEMGADGYFDHNSADGTEWWKRILQYYPRAHYTHWTVGENLLFATPDIGADAALKMWINSPMHLANLKNPTWRDLGVSAVHVSDAGGVYGHGPVTIVTTDFGARH